MLVRLLVLLAVVTTALVGTVSATAAKTPQRDVISGTGSGSGFPDCTDQRIGWTYTTADGKTWTCTFGYYGDYWA